YLSHFSMILCPPPLHTLFPYTTLFRSDTILASSCGFGFILLIIRHLRYNLIETGAGCLFKDICQRGNDGIVILRALSPLVLYQRSEEHTSELQSRFDLVCRLLLEKKKK